jgi:hypothetical protein
VVVEFQNLTEKSAGTLIVVERKYNLPAARSQGNGSLPHSSLLHNTPSQLVTSKVVNNKMRGRMKLATAWSKKQLGKCKDVMQVEMCMKLNVSLFKQ